VKAKWYGQVKSSRITRPETSALAFWQLVPTEDNEDNVPGTTTDDSNLPLVLPVRAK